MVVIQKFEDYYLYLKLNFACFLYGCVNWSLIFRKGRKLRVCENMVLRGIFGRRREEVTGEWLRLFNEELNDLYTSPKIVRVIKSRRMKWFGHERVWVRRGGV